jgi:hypothetical protein
VRIRALVVAATLGLGLGLTSTGTALAASYPPPTTGQGQVDRSVVHPGECVHFSGGGFAKGASLVITDNGHRTTTGKANQKGNFRVRVCFSSNATLGRHVLRASGEGYNTAPRVVSAEVRVEGLSESRNGQSSGGGVSGRSNEHGIGGLPFSGADIVAMVAAAAALIAGGVLLNRITAPRRRRAGG